MINSLVYLTRRCPRKCDYCRLRDSNLQGPELNKWEWVRAFKVLQNLEVDFNLILGNETWLLGGDLLHIMCENKIPFALYTTCPETLFEKYREIYFNSGVIDNLSCGIDYPYSYLLNVLKERGSFNNDMELKSFTAWKGLIWTRANYPTVDCQGTVTVSKENYRLLPNTVEELTNFGIFCGINFIHWDKKGFDFFPSEEEMKLFLMGEEDVLELEYCISKIGKNYIQNFEMLKEDVHLLTSMGWHCGGNPYGGPTVDSDGSLRCCGYRTGSRTKNFSIFDLEDVTNIPLWREAVYLDCKECPGCFWSYPWMYHYWLNSNDEFGKKVFVNHAGKHISSERWSKRRLE